MQLKEQNKRKDRNIKVTIDVENRIIYLKIIILIEHIINYHDEQKDKYVGYIFGI